MTQTTTVLDAPGQPVEGPGSTEPVTTTQTSVTQQTTGQQTPWMTRHLTAAVVLLLTGTVCILALWFRDRDAIVALMGSYGAIIGFLFGSRTALKIPGRDT